MLRYCDIDFNRSWDKHLPLVEFSYNNSKHLSISKAPFESFHGRRCRSLMGWFEVGESSPFCPEMVYDALKRVHMIRDRLKIDHNTKKVIR